jgi:DNA-directed RNA polymerase specialized sigma24 family protein
MRNRSNFEIETGRQIRKTDPIERLIRLVELLVRLKIREISPGRSQKEMILVLADIGMGGGEIATYLGVSRTTVNPILSRARRTPSMRRNKATGSTKKG